MYPHWIQMQFEDGRGHCARCKAAQETSNITTIGVRAPHTWSTKPLCHYSTVCALCGNQSNFTIDLTREDLLAAVEAKFDEFAAAPPVEPPPVVIPKTPSGLPDVTPSKEEDERPKPIRPSRRRNQPLKPPTDAEVKQFLKKLDKTSFKTDSKSYKKLTGPEKPKPLGPDDIKGSGEEDR